MFSFSGCEPFKKLENTNAEGAEAYTQGNVLSDCMNFCKQTVECLSFDFDNGPNPWQNTRCWIHTSAASTKSQAGVDHYQKQECPTEPPPTPPPAGKFGLIYIK